MNMPKLSYIHCVPAKDFYLWYAYRDIYTSFIQYCRFIIFLSFGMCRLTFTRTCSRQRSTYKQYVSLKRLLTTFNETFHLVRFFVRLISFSFKSITKNKTFYSPSCIRSRTLNHSKKDLINF